jgi:hypothetical protein
VINEIDLKDILARSVGSLHRDLVTRSTGAKVRTGIAEALNGRPVDVPVVLNFSAVRVLDCSCADEVVAKLLLEYAIGPEGRAVDFVVRGLTETQSEEIDHVLRRRRLTLVAEEVGERPRLLGEVAPSAAAAWDVLADRGGAGEEEIATALALPPLEARHALEALVGAGVVRRSAGRYLPLTAA